MKKLVFVSTVFLLIFGNGSAQVNPGFTEAFNKTNPTPASSKTTTVTPNQQQSTSPLSSQVSYTTKATPEQINKQKLEFAEYLAQPSVQTSLKQLHSLFNHSIKSCKANSSLTIQSQVTQGKTAHYQIQGMQAGNCLVTITTTIPSPQAGMPANTSILNCAFTAGSINYLTKPDLQSTTDINTVLTFSEAANKIMHYECKMTSTTTQ